MYYLNIKLKTVLPFLMVCCAFATQAQLKMGDNPTIINSNALLELESANKGLLIPRVALTATNSFAPLSAHVQGMVVYNTVTAGTPPNNVVPGYYLNNGSNWQRITTTADLSNIYFNNGVLTSNRIVAQGTNTLAFTGSVVNAFSVDGSTFSVDAATNRVGIGTTLPISNFHVEGSQSGSVSILTSSTTLTDAQHKILVQNAATAITISLPDALSVLGREYVISRYVGSTGAITIAASGTNLIQAIGGTVGTTTTIGTHNTTGRGLGHSFTAVNIGGVGVWVRL